MYNGFDARDVDSNGLGKLGIEHTKNKMVGRGVLLDVARFRGVDWLKDGDAIANDELDKCAKEQNVEIVRKNPDQIGFAVNPRRRVVERFFAWINRNRRLAKDFEATIVSAETFLYAASVMLLTRRLARAK